MNIMKSLTNFQFVFCESQSVHVRCTDQKIEVIYIDLKNSSRELQSLLSIDDVLLSASDENRTRFSPIPRAYTTNVLQEHSCIYGGDRGTRTRGPYPLHGVYAPNA